MPQVQGTGPKRLVSLKPLRVFALEMTELLGRRANTCIPINQIVPTYKETFGRDFDVSSYGHPKLIKVLEAIPDTIRVSIGEGVRV